MIAVIISNKKCNISLVFITQLNFKVPEDVKLNSRRYSLLKISNKKELQQIAINHSSDIYFKDFMKLYNICNA